LALTGWQCDVADSFFLHKFNFCLHIVFRHDESLPQHLRSFTAGAVFVRVLTYGVEVLQFVKHYSEAVNQLEQLIGQHVYRLEYRGRWYDRLALNLDYHLKQPMQVILLCFLFFGDNSVTYYGCPMEQLWTSFILSFVLSSSFFSSPNLSRRRLDVCHTCTHGVASVRI